MKGYFSKVYQGMKELDNKCDVAGYNCVYCLVFRVNRNTHKYRCLSISSSEYDLSMYEKL